MGLFTKDTEADAIRMIDCINREMREISASVHLNYNQIDGRNNYKVLKHYKRILTYLSSYMKIKSNLSEFERGMFLGATVDVWNGERVGVIMWEAYIANTLDRIKHELNC